MEQIAFFRYRNDEKNNNNPKTNTAKLAKNRIVEDFMIVETGKNFDCFDPEIFVDRFKML